MYIIYLVSSIVHTMLGVKHNPVVGIFIDHTGEREGGVFAGGGPIRRILVHLALAANFKNSESVQSETTNEQTGHITVRLFGVHSLK